MKTNLPKVAIIGRPNVGKSTLFNRLIQKRLSIMADEPGVTRDRLFHKSIWLGKEFILVDTGGFSRDLQVDFQKEINTQIQIALHEADLIIFLADSNGIMKEDMITAGMVKKIKKPIIVGINKSDNIDSVRAVDNYYKLGLGKPIAISSIHGIGIGDLLDEIIHKLPKKNISEDDKLTRIGILGKPNVGKSTLVNSLLNDDRVIVSPVSGTTRDAIDTKLHWNGIDYILTDTAGIKKNKKSLNDIEWYAELRSQLTIGNSDITLLMLDATQGIEHIDSNIMEALIKSNKPTIIIMNKTDILDMKQRQEFQDEVRNKFKYAQWVPIIFISAINKKGIAKIFETIEQIQKRLATKISKSHLSEFLMDIQMVKKPPRHNGIEIKLKFMNYENKGLPTFVFFVNRPEYIHFSYKRFIENQIRILFNFEGIPVQFKYKKS